MLSEGKDYRYVNFDDTDITGIELLIPDYLGVVFHYGKVKVDERGEIGHMTFGYVIVHPGEHDIDTLNSDEEFHTIMGDILTNILIAKVDDEARNDNTEKLDLF